MKKENILLILIVLATGLQAQNDTVNGYVCSQGVDTTKWITLDSPTITYGITAVNIEFDFHYFGNTSPYSRVLISNKGSVTFGEILPEPTTSTIPPLNSPTIYPFGYNVLYWSNSCSYWKHQQIGSPGQRVLVFEYRSAILSDEDTCSFQVQLHEADNSILFVYGEAPSSTPNATILMADSPDTYICIENGHAHRQLTPGQTQSWPGAYHYYSFVPHSCVQRVKAYLSYGDSSSTTIRIQGNAQDSIYQIEYGLAGFHLGTGTIINTSLNPITINGLAEGEVYDFYVTPICADGIPGVTSHVRFWSNCPASPHNQIPYWDLQGPNVTCRYGHFNALTSTGIIDYGYHCDTSRHTVHSVSTETDPRTLNRLHTVPPGFCYSVRLGNWNIGGERESVTYRIHVDTNDYNLLLLRYAIVEQDPSHNASAQPFFTLSIYDTNGHIADPCYHANFVAGDPSDWNTVLPPDYQYNPSASPIVWHDWQVVGVDLTPMHGMDVDVVIDNADCAGGGHYGYGYFTLESGTKHIRAAYCGDISSNIFRAPKGFSYRWYRAGNPSVTLSTADTLFVSDAETYFCEATYNIPNRSCSILLSACGGSIYPSAAFDIEPLNSCKGSYHFLNRSFVARDSLHLQATPNPCDSYLWRFDDGTTSYLASPIHQFQPGTHSVTLYATIGDGACVDSVTQTFYIDDTVSLSYISQQACSSFTFRDSTYTASGNYIYADTLDGCTTLTHLQLTILPSYNLQTADTFQLGQPYQWRGTDYSRPGTYSDSFTTTEGCDSSYRLILSSIEHHDSVICQDDFPILWHGDTLDTPSTDTISLLAQGGADSIIIFTFRQRNHPTYAAYPQMVCGATPYYSIPIPDTLQYTWTCDPINPQIEDLSQLNPLTPSQLIILLDYPDNPSCPVSDTLSLLPLRSLVAQLEVQPDWISEGESDIVAADGSGNVDWREWYINDTLQEGQGPTYTYHSHLEGDSVTVMLVVGLDSCTDTAYKTIGVRHRELLWFPNIFTPDLPTNSLFRAYGINIRDYDLQIYTRQGERVFRTHHIEEGWDGTSRGIPLPQSAYVYMCTYTSPTGGRQRVYGTVTLIR